MGVDGDQVGGVHALLLERRGRAVADGGRATKARMSSCQHIGKAPARRRERSAALGDDRDRARHPRHDQRPGDEVVEVRRSDQRRRHDRHAEPARDHPHDRGHEVDLVDDPQLDPGGARDPVERATYAVARADRDHRDRDEVDPAHLAARGERVVGGTDDAEVIVDEGSHVDLAVHLLGRADAELDLVGEDVRQELVRRAVVDDDADVGIRLRERAHRSRHQGRADRRRDGEMDLAAPALAEVAAAGLEHLDGLQDPLGQADRRVRRGRRLERARRAVEQAGRQRRLDLADQDADRRRRDREPLGRRRQATRAVDRDERAQLLHGQQAEGGHLKKLQQSVKLFRLYLLDACACNASRQATTAGPLRGRGQHRRQAHEHESTDARRPWPTRGLCRPAGPARRRMRRPGRHHPAAAAPTAADCSALASATGLPNPATVITAATFNAATATVAEHCQINGAINRAPASTARSTPSTSACACRRRGTAASTWAAAAAPTAASSIRSTPPSRARP